MALSQLQSGSSVTLTSHIMESLIFCMAVYKTTSDAAAEFFRCSFGKVEPLICYGFEEEAGGMQAIFVARNLCTGRIVVACRGTSGFKDVVQDLKYLQSRLSFVKGAAAHWGFAERAESIPTDFLCKLLEAGEEVIFAGHSLGGAVASLLTLRILESTKGKFDEQVHCVTFGCPLFANCKLADWINSNYKDVFTHIVSRRDVVPKILPLVSTVQKLVYANEDHLEGLLVLRKVLELIPGIPLASLLSSVERRIPYLLKLLLRNVIKLALPTGMTGMIGSYAFAGHVVMLDTEVAATQPLKLASAVDMNVWHSQLGFAFGFGFDVAMIAEHMLERYRDGILRAVPHSKVTSKISNVASLMRTWTPGGLDRCSIPAGLGMPGNSFRNIDVGGGGSLGKDLIRQHSMIVHFTPEDRMGVDRMEIQIHCDSNGVESSVLMKQRIANGRDLVFGGEQRHPTPKVVNKKMLDGAPRGALTRTRSDCQRSLTRSSSRLNSAKLERSKTLNSVSRSSIPWTPLRRTGSLARSEEITMHCRACTHLKAHMNITSCCHQVSKKEVGLGRFLETIGKVARHLRLLDNLCYATFIRILMSNLVG